MPQDNGNVAPNGSEKLVVTLSGVVVDGPPLAPDALARLRRDLVGHPVQVAAIFAAAKDLERAFAALGRVLDRVLVPAQSLADGAVLHLVVVEGYVERIDTTRVPEPVARKLAAILAPLVGKHGVTQRELERRLLLAADLPGTSLRSTLAPGTAAGSTVLIIDAAHRPVTGFLTVDNTLPSALGRNAYGLGINFNSVLGLGETVYARASGLPNTGHKTSFLDPTPRNRALAAGFIVPIGHDGLTLNLEGTDARTAARHDPTLPGFGSRFRRLSGRLRYPIIRSRALTASVEAQFDAQEERVRIIDPIVLPLSIDRLRIARAEGDVRAFLPGGGIATGRITASFGIDELGARTAADATPALPLSRAGSDASFRKLELTASVEQPFGQHLAMALQSRAQTSFGQVMANSEEIGIATIDGLSPLPSGTLQGDAGYVVRGELRMPFAVSLRQAGGSLTPYGFGAYGGVRFQNPTVFERRSTDAYAYGGGFRVAASTPSGSPGLSAGMEYGRAYLDGRAREADRVVFTIVTQF